MSGFVGDPIFIDGIDERVNDERSNTVDKIDWLRGRFGNRISIYAYNFLYHIHFGLPYKNIDTTIKYPIITKEIKEQNRIEIPELVDYQYTRIEKGKEGKHSFPHDIRFYQNYRKLLQDNLIPNNLKEINYDITIHVRTDDIGNSHESYTALPVSFYKKCLDDFISNRTDIENEEIKVLIVSKKPHNDFTKKILDSVVNLCKQYRGNIENTETNTETNFFTVDIQHSSVEDDFKTLLCSKNIIMSVSTYSYWGAFLSPFCKKLYVPDGDLLHIYGEMTEILNCMGLVVLETSI